MCSTCIRSLGPFRISLFNITSLAWTHLFMQRNFKSYCYAHQKTICSTNITAINGGAYCLLLMWSVLLSDICKVLKAAYDVWHISLQKHEDGREMQCGHDRKVTETWLWDWPTTTMAWEAHLLLRLKFHWLMQVNKINSGQIRGQDYRCCRLQLSVNVLIDAGLRRKINHFSWLENSKFGGSSWSRKGPCDCAIPTHEVMHSESTLMAWNVSTWPRKGVV